jgi:hypothetical protein
MDTHAAQLLDHEPPAGTALKGKGDVVSPLEPAEPLSNATTISWRNPAAAHLAGLGIQIVKRNLASMKIESSYDAHWGPP